MVGAVCDQSCQGEQGWLVPCVTRVVKIHDVAGIGQCYQTHDVAGIDGVDISLTKGELFIHSSHSRAPLKSPVESKMETMISPRYELEVTDGWYGILASVDVEMCRLIESKLVTVGTKLMTHSAELLNCDQGCSPPEKGTSAPWGLGDPLGKHVPWDRQEWIHLKQAEDQPGVMHNL
uniref:BRCA2 OB1 domain-containing protein n=1 Tax=Timema cristinae TaxID=61476 RepID=A0A7R9D7K7_TIMCR|nr:unnamed protein product [Timema cristinae]